MSHWDGEQIVRWPDHPHEDNPAWTWIDCGCSNGLEWGGDYPRECRDCQGNARLCCHEPTGTIALYPGGPLSGAHRKKATA